MAEEKKEKASGAGFKTVLKVIVGLALVVLGIALVILWFSPLIELIKGCLGLFLIMAGAMTIAIAKE